MPTPYFEVAHLTKHFSTDESTVAAIQDVSFSLQKGQFLSILGPSGCGKSTLFNLIAGLMQPDCGDIRLQGESMLLRPGLTGYMLQKDLLLPWRTIADNIILSKTLHGTRRQAALKSAVSDIAACGLRDLLNRRPDECSGGQRQRAALVRTLARSASSPRAKTSTSSTPISAWTAVPALRNAPTTRSLRVKHINTRGCCTQHPLSF